MKHEDVIKRLQRICKTYQYIGDYTAIEALNIAISAVEEKERDKVHCDKCKHKRGGSGYYECSLHGWRVKRFDSCKDGERRMK